MANPTSANSLINTTPKDNSVTTAKLVDEAVTAAKIGTMPSFSAYMSTTQTGVATGTWTKVEFDAEDWDTEGWYDHTTNYRFTPLIAGKYQVNSSVLMGSIGNTERGWIAVYKSGSRIYQGNISYQGAAGNIISLASIVVDLNGSSDYIEVFGYQDTGSDKSFVAGSTKNHFQAIRVSS